MNDILLSVIVATKDNSKNLLRLLESLDSQYMPAHQYEVLVANAHSTDDTSSMVESLTFRYAMEHCVSRRPGLMAARNQAVEEAKGDRLLFLSDDLVAPPTLLETHLQAHKDIPHHVVRGPIVPLESETIPMLDRPPPAIRLFFTINNSSASKMAILKVGGFAETIDPELEDREVGWRLQQDNWTERFVPAAYVYRPSTQEETLLDLKRQAVLLARTAVAHYMQHPDPSVAKTTGIHPRARALSRLTAGEGVYALARFLRETSLGQVHWIRTLIEQRIFMTYYRRALAKELEGKEL